jgi:hypothetical protein
VNFVTSLQEQNDSQDEIMRTTRICCKPVPWPSACWRPASWLPYPPPKRPSWVPP